MGRVLKSLTLLSFLALLPFGYFYYRDVISTSQAEDLGDCTPYNISWEGKQKVRVTWQTKGKCVGYLRYGRDAQTLDLLAVDVEGSVRKSSHEVMIENNEDVKRYYATIYSAEKVYGQSGQPIVIRID